MPLRWRATALLLLAACAHEAPPEPVIGVLDSLPALPPPVRLTLNSGSDEAPSYTPDGRGVWYSWERLDRSDHDFCLGLLPLTGGTRQREVCHTAATANPDSVNRYLWAAPHPDGRRVAWFRLSAGRGSPLSFPFAGEVVVAPLADEGASAPVTWVHQFPYLVAPGHYHQQPERLQWLNDSTLVYLAVLIAVEFGQGLPQDTLHSGVEIGTLTLASDGVHPGYIPGTTGASGLAVAPDDQVYFTLNGDNRIYRTGLAGTPIDTVFDLGPGTTIARDPIVIDTTAYAIVDGDVTYRYFANLGSVQSDGGGALWKVTPGTRTLVDSTRRWRHPVLAPDGSSLVVEGRDLATGLNDLYLMRLP